MVKPSLVKPPSTSLRRTADTRLAHSKTHHPTPVHQQQPRVVHAAPRYIFRRSMPRIQAKMFVPADGLNGQAPEAKGAAYLKRLFTFVAIRIVQAQLEGLGNDGGFAPQATGMDGSVQSPDYSDLRRAMEEVPLGDGDEWLEALLSENPRLSLRIIEVRSQYCNDFDYEVMKGLTEEGIRKASTRLMQRHVELSSGLSSGDGHGHVE